MSQRRFGRSQKAITLLPLALLSAAWTAGLAAPSVTLTAADQQTDTPLPGGVTVPSVPSEAIEAPASMSRPGDVAPGVAAGRGAAAVRTASTNGIPSAALAAYQRAETVINRADAGCSIPWQLVAAIGRVESDHGRFGGNVLDSDGVAQPGIRGIPLDGSKGTARISDTDAGQLDGDRKFDRAVGPMQFIPSTWSVVGVDADGDGERNPQDIDDAALASAVYLCSGNEDLSATPGQRSAVFRYNNSDDYVDLVLSIMEAYMEGDFSSVPTATASGESFEPDPGAAPLARGPQGGAPAPRGGSGGSDSPGGSGGGSATPDVDNSGSTGGGSNNGGGSDDGGSNNGGNDGGSTTPPPTNNPPKPPPAPPKVPNPTKPVKDVITGAEARLKCMSRLGLDESDLQTGGLLGGLLSTVKTNIANLNSCITSTRTD